ncbi:M23 family metallopeptidase [Streptomyces sp. NPDC047315]|uniref:M23 family metallopeptidase n=1 Tax=Streptomyces sp. NPDC047315 TaxID=3155142 RepID=UPI00341168B2
MNDQHAHAGYGHDTYPTGSFDTDPLFGALPGTANPTPTPATDYDAGHSGQYDASAWDTGSHHTTSATPTATGYGGYDAYASPQHAAADGYDTTGQWDAAAWNQSGQTGQFENAAAAFTYDTTGTWTGPTFDSGSYDATAWNGTGEAEPLPLVPPQYVPEQEFPDGTQEFGPEAVEELAQQLGADQSAHLPHTAHADATEVIDAVDTSTTADVTDSPYADSSYAEPPHGDSAYDDSPYALDEGIGTEPARAAHDAGATRAARRGSGGGSRGRRRTPAKRSALLTVAVPSACVMGVAGIAAASVGGIGGTEQKKDDTTTLAAADTTPVENVAANNKMDTQLAALSADARDFGDRASRTQERLDLKARQEAERQKRAEEAKRKEALRPKFALPVAQKGLSTYYGESGVNWMALHTGIDFPVPYGAEVMAASDGTVRTQINPAYGNMVIVTAPDGTETWYCHLASAKIRSGKVKAGDVIGYAGDSGNSTGPHLHFEVRPGGGSHINPLTWLQSKGLNPL